MEKLVLIGGGGHCKSVIDVIRSHGKFEIIGVLDSQLPIRSLVLNIVVMGNDSMIGELITKYTNFHITVGHIESSSIRRKIARSLMEAQANLPNIISASALVSDYAALGKGITVMHRATIQPDAKIGDFTIVNDHALIEHDAKIGQFCHISTGAIVNGNAEIGNDVFIGSGAVIVHGAKIADGSFIKANQLVK